MSGTVEGKKISRRSRNATNDRSYPSLSSGAVAGVDQCWPTRRRGSLSVETQVGTEKLNTLVVAFLNHPSLIGLGSLIGVGVVARGQGDCSPGVGVRNLTSRQTLMRRLRR